MADERAPCEEPDRFFSLYQRQLVDLSVIVIDELLEVRIRFVAVVRRPVGPHQRIFCDGVDEQVRRIRAQITNKTSAIVLLKWPLTYHMLCDGVTGCGRYPGENIQRLAPTPISPCFERAGSFLISWTTAKILWFATSEAQRRGPMPTLSIFPLIRPRA